MSLIEEALRRAEKDKAESIAARSQPVEPLRPAGRERSTRTRLALSLGLCCIASVGVGVWLLLDGSPTAGRSLSPRQSAAAEAAVDRPSDATHPAPAPTFAAPAVVAKTSDRTGTADLSAARASEPVAPLPDVDPQAARDAMDGVLAAVGGFLDSAAERTTKAASQPVPPAKPAALREEEEEAVAEASAAPGERSDPVAAAGMDDRTVATTPDQRPAGAGAYKLSGIMRGGGETVAIINGYFVSVGQTVGDATVLDIGRHSVRLRAGDREFTIRM